MPDFYMISLVEGEFAGIWRELKAHLLRLHETHIGGKPAKATESMDSWLRRLQDRPSGNERIVSLRKPWATPAVRKASTNLSSSSFSPSSSRRLLMSSS